MTISVALRNTYATPPASVAVTAQQAEIEQLGDAIAELSSRIQAATYELLVLIREFDEGAGWNYGFLSCAHWLNWRTGLALGAAREKVRVARTLGDLPLLSAAMQRGQLSYSKVRALTRVASPENERRLLDFARCGTAAHVERLVRGWRRVDRMAEAKDARRRHESQHLRTWVDDDGMVVVRGRLSPEIGAVVQGALEAASERLRQDSADTDPATAETTPGSGGPTRSGSWPRARWRQTWTAGRRAIDTRSSSMSMKACWRPTTRSANRYWKTVRTFPRRRRDESPVTPPLSSCATRLTAPCSMSAARGERCRRLSAAR